MNDDLKDKIWLQKSSTFEEGGWTIYTGRIPEDVMILKETEIVFHDLRHETIESIPCEYINNTIKHEFGPYELNIISEERLIIKYGKNDFEYISCSEYSNSTLINKEEIEKKLMNKLWCRTINILKDNPFNFDDSPSKKLKSREILILLNQEYNSFIPNSNFKVRIALEYLNIPQMNLFSEENEATGWKLVEIADTNILCFQSSIPEPKMRFFFVNIETDGNLFLSGKENIQYHLLG